MNSREHECPLEKFDARGLGDVVAKVLDVIGIGRLVKVIKGRRCGGCRKRREAMNRAMPLNGG